MKKIGIVLSGVVTLMLLSFAPAQEKKVVRLKNGNYKLQNLKMEKGDVEKLQELADEMSQWFVENADYGLGKGEKEDGREKYEDLMAIFESEQGFKAVAAFGAEDQHYAMEEEISSNIFKTTLAFQYESKDDKKKEEFRGQIDDIMGKYLR